VHRRDGGAGVREGGAPAWRVPVPIDALTEVSLFTTRSLEDDSH